MPKSKNKPTVEQTALSLGAGVLYQRNAKRAQLDPSYRNTHTRHKNQIRDEFMDEVDNEPNPSVRYRMLRMFERGVQHEKGK